MLNPHTPAVLIKEILPFVDMVLVMTVNPGYGGQKFILETLPKIREIRTMIEALGRPVDIQVDGGIDIHTTPQVVAARRECAGAGTSVFRAPEGIRAAIQALRKAAESV